MKNKRHPLSRDERISARMKEPLGCAHLNRKDVLIMLLVCAIYAVFAFTNLGATRIPETGYDLVENGDDVIFEFDEPQNLVYFMAYPGYGEGVYSVYGSMDGKNWEFMQLTNLFDSAEEEEMVLPGIVQRYADMYKWARRHMNEEVKYVRLAPESGAVHLLEVAFLDQNGNPVTPSSVTAAGEPLTQLSDEQDLIPIEPTYQTDFYFDEIYHARSGYELLHGTVPLDVHPPLGKVIIALSIQLFGMTPFGWRFLGTLAGVLMLPALYILAKELFGKTSFAAMAEILLAADFMHYTQTRIATLDSFTVLWIILMYLYMHRYTCMNFNRQPLKETLHPLFLSGLFFAIGAATKWICLYAGIGLLIIWITVLVKRHQECAWAQKNGEYPDLVAEYKHKFRTTFWLSMLFFIVIPLAVYVLSYVPYMVASGGEYGLANVWGEQVYMLTYHVNLEEAHPFQSMWYTWPLDIRPVLFYSVHSDVLGETACFSTMGNPFVWWGGVIAAICLIFMAAKNPGYRSFGLFQMTIAALCQYVPWMFIHRAVFIYHYFSVVPFLILITVYFLHSISKRFRYGKTVSWIYVGACAALFGIFYPVTTGIAAPTAYIQALRWLPSWPFY